MAFLGVAAIRWILAKRVDEEKLVDDYRYLWAEAIVLGALGQR